MQTISLLINQAEKDRQMSETIFKTNLDNP